MNWEAIAAIGQMLGSVAVFVTLAYLAVQVRHARSEVRRSISQSRGEATRELSLARATNEKLNTAYKKADAAVGGRLAERPFMSHMMASGDVTFEEAAAVFWDQMAWFNYRVQVIPYVDELPVGDRAAFDRAILSYGSDPLQKLWYNAMKATISPDAVRYIDNLLAQPE